MSQRDSGFARVALDAYATPPWVTEYLLPHIPDRITSVWEPAAGTGQMVGVLASRFTVEATDIDCGRDFLAESKSDCAAIITNPPYTLAQEFIEHALDLTRPHDGFVAMRDAAASLRMRIYDNRLRKHWRAQSVRHVRCAA
jgi:hypothetical protein